ncbi:PhzF family phenazine biosynthesis protein [Arthrobacter crystallopoietes BAB-32]|uniref:PhzF family phenazine biosynthesis protein n=1 Tax=Arthrobacter crystallopoietes BAB-32 TaxID=1246476 RepID=N1UUI9_9MICC|nr:PhzF family phenazine biosynthesis protein [Arthrobacter crystallopoietes]EMY32705.1 PhzF family phenazine biosynthesis protein [Arthrobacter crystallopoietes BAB-32]
MSTHEFSQVDVFTTGPGKGNPLAVVSSAETLTDEQMRSFANWTNLSETTFLLPPTDPAADYRVRIFTPSDELPFAGHPTLGTAHVWLRGGGKPRTEGRIVQECAAGLVNIKNDGGRLAFAAPARRRAGELPEENVQRICAALGLDRSDVLRHQWADNGPQWQALQLTDAQKVLDVEPDWAALAPFGVGLIGAYPSGADIDFEVRGLMGFEAMPAEDPVTGSLNAALGQWLIGAGLAPDSYIARQGTRLGRDGRVYVSAADGEIWVGGDVQTVISGTVKL